MTRATTPLPKRYSACLGFTLIELVITLVVFAILVAIAAPSMKWIVVNQGVKNASFDVFSALLYTRSEAAKRNTSVAIAPVSPGSWQNGWNITVGGTTLKTNPAYSGIAITGPTSITYSRDGRATVTGTPAYFVVNVSPGVPQVSPRCTALDPSGMPRTTQGATSC